MRRLFPIVLVLLSVPAGSAIAAKHRVFAGRSTSVPPYMAFLSASTENAYWTCGATAISANVVLTAAHCMVDPETNRIVESATLGLVFGQDDPRRALNEGTASVNSVVRFVLHPDFGEYRNGVVTHDVALLETRDPVPGVLPLLPPERSDLLTPGTAAVVMGWGLEDMSRPDSSPTTLQSGRMPIRQSSACSSWLEHYNPYVMLCAGSAKGAAPCAGDSGGPLVVRDPATGADYEAGVVSFGEDCQVEGGISVFARVGGSPLREFVGETAAKLQDEATPVSASGVTAMSNSSNRSLSVKRARRAAARYAKRTWHWKVRRVSCARRSTDGIVCRVDGSRQGRTYFSRMLVMLDDRGRTAITDAR